jgi:hypothetical protein
VSDTDPVLDIDGARLIGHDPDPGAQIERRIMVGWALVGIFFTLGTVALSVDQFRLTILPQDPIMLDWARFFAFFVSFLNVGVWMWFPLDDLRVLRRWVRTERRIFPANTSEFYAILLEMILLLLLIVGALVGPVWFGLAGTCVFLWNAFGFAWIRRHVAGALEEARVLYKEQEPARSQLCLQALEAIEKHWSCGVRRWWSDQQQVRHVTLVITFALVTGLAVWGEISGSAILKALAYSAGGMTLVVAEVWIALRRSSRDSSLLRVREELRSLDVPRRELPST